MEHRDPLKRYWEKKIRLGFIADAGFMPRGTHAQGSERKLYNKDILKTLHFDLGTLCQAHEAQPRYTSENAN